MTTLHELLQRWRSEAGVLERCGASEAAATTWTRANELEATLREHGESLLGLEEASTESGYSTRRLRELVNAGELPNRGRKGAPRFRRADLPRKRSASGSGGFDAEAEALSIRRIG